MTKLNTSTPGRTSNHSEEEQDEIDKEVDKAFDRIRIKEEKGEVEEVIELDDTDLTEEVAGSAEEYAQMKGPSIFIPRRQGQPFKGKLVEWNDPNSYRVVWFDGFAYLTKTLKADDLKNLNPFLGVSLAKMTASEGTRSKMTSLFEDVIPKSIHGQEINNGGKAETLAEGIRTFVLPGGIEGAAATSKAGYTYETEKDEQGNDVPKDRNEDMWLVDTETGLVGVFDGMGGGKKGMKAAEIAATTIAANQNDIPDAVTQTRQALATDPDIGGKDGVCFATVRPIVGENMEINQCGDVDVYHFSPKGKVKYAPGQQMELGKDPQSSFEYFDHLIDQKMPRESVQAHVNMLARGAKKNRNEMEEAGVSQIIERILANQKPVVERSNPMYGSLRRVVMRGVTKKEAVVANFKTKENVEAGDWIITMSDGVSDNLTENELERFLSMAISRDWTPEELAKKIAQVVDERIKMKAKEDPIAQKNHYKLDNATIVVMRVKRKEESAKINMRAA